jgi:hypothetical protein
MDPAFLASEATLKTTAALVPAHTATLVVACTALDALTVCVVGVAAVYTRGQWTVVADFTRA